MTAPIIIVHRRNRRNEILSLPQNCWIEIDIDLLENIPYISHDPLVLSSVPEKFSEFLPYAIEHGVKGFIFDCKREGAAKTLMPFIEKYKITDYFFLNEMEIAADMALAANSAHRIALRIWQHRKPLDVIRYIEELRSAKQNAPNWVWIDCWHRDLPKDMAQTFIPIGQIESRKLQQMSVGLCFCSPELYTHDYSTAYNNDALEAIYRSVLHYRQKLLQVGLVPNAVCTKFPWLWTKDVNELEKSPAERS